MKKCWYKQGMDCIHHNPMYLVVGLLLMATLAVFSAFASDLSCAPVIIQADESAPTSVSQAPSPNHP